MAENRIIYSIEFLTQIHQAWDGTEQRAALRTNPRRSFSYDYVGITEGQSQWLRMLTHMPQNEPFEFPLWHAGIESREYMYRGSPSCYVGQERIWDYYNSGAVFLWSKSDIVGGNRYYIKHMAGTGWFEIVGSLSVNYPPKFCKLYPVVWGVLKNDDSFVDLSACHTENTVNFELLQEQRVLYPEFPQAYDMWHDEPLDEEDFGMNFLHEGVEVFMMRPPWIEGLAHTYMKHANRLDTQSGIFRWDLKTKKIMVNRNYSYVFTTLPHIHNMQRFFYRMMGRLKSFYMPTWLSDFTLTDIALAGANELYVNETEYSRYYTAASRRRKIIIFFKDATVQIITIAAYSVNSQGTKGVIFLDAPLTRELNMKDIFLISFLVRGRFDSDNLSFDYESSIVANCDFSFAEVDE